MSCDPGSAATGAWSNKGRRTMWHQLHNEMQPRWDLSCEDSDYEGAAKTPAEASLWWWMLKVTWGDVQTITQPDKWWGICEEKNSGKKFMTGIKTAAFLCQLILGKMLKRDMLWKHHLLVSDRTARLGKLARSPPSGELRYWLQITPPTGINCTVCNAIKMHHFIFISLLSPHSKQVAASIWPRWVLLVQSVN